MAGAAVRKATAEPARRMFLIVIGLEGVRNNAEGKQELTVRGADGQVRGVPLAGIRQA